MPENRVTRISLPDGLGSYYNAKTDTDPNHFSLYSDVDNILIKRFGKGQPTINDGLSLAVAHNLSYIPFFMAYYEPFEDGYWSVLNNQYNLFSVPDAICAIDTANLNFTNYGGHVAGNIKPAYDIFYDDMDNTGVPSIVASSAVYKVARPGKSANSLNPNDYIMHSDLNNFKILKSGNATVTIPGATNVVTFAHGANVNAPYKAFIFVKPSDGKVFLTGSAMHLTYDESFGVTSQMGSTNIKLRSFFTTADKTVNVYYLIYGTGKAGTIDNTGMILSVDKSGSNVLTETNPDNYNFHSKYPTLKYYESNSWNMGSVTNTTLKTIAHNLGYTPFFVGFLKDLQGIFANGYAIAPYYLGRSSIPSPNRNVGGFVYVDNTNIYLKAHYQPNAVGTAFAFNWYYKLFKNNLGL